MYRRFERFSFAISDISRHWHKIASAEMEKYGLKGTHSVYLLALAAHGEGLSAPQICEICGKDKSDVSRMMKVMEDSGTVTKDGGFQNRYGGVFRLTEKGSDIAQSIRARANKAVELAGADLSEEQREIFYDALESISAKLRQLSRDGLPLAENETKLPQQER